MIGLNNDEYSTNPLPIWATLTEVSDALGISRGLVRASVRAAFKREELWVKKKDGRLLVNTLSDAYTSQVSQWLRQKELHALLSDVDVDVDVDADADADAQAECDLIASAEKRSRDRETAVSRSQVIYDWVEFCKWLSTQGLSVFYNVLVEDPNVALQWQWGDLRGAYQYLDLKDAVIDALDCKLNMISLREQEPLPPPKSSASEPKKRGRLWDFVEKKRLRAFEEWNR